MATIQKLTAYFGNAIRQMGNRKANIATMKRVILASLCHSVMIQKPSERHRYCPLGENSWCMYTNKGQVSSLGPCLLAVAYKYL